MKELVEKILERFEDLREGLLTTNTEYNSNLIDAMMRAGQIVQEVASEYNNGYIPCSEMLPEEPKTTGYVEEDYFDGKLTEYIVMILGAKKPTTLYYAGDGHWYDVASQEYYPVIAWQPLPEPYEEHW